MSTTRTYFNAQVDLASAGTPVDVYTAALPTVLSNIHICNANAAPVLIRIWLRSLGVAVANKHRLVYDGQIKANDFGSFQLGLTMVPTDVITVRADNNQVSCNIFGYKIS